MVWKDAQANSAVPVDHDATYKVPVEEDVNFKYEQFKEQRGMNTLEVWERLRSCPSHLTNFVKDKEDAKKYKNRNNQCAGRQAGRNS